MPLSINVGLSKKASRDYQSTGYSINVTAELDQSLLAKPEELQRQIGDLYAQAADALEKQAGSPPSAPQSAQNRRPPQRSGYQGRNGNGNGNGNAYARNGNGYARNGNGHSTGGNDQMTASQRRAIVAIAQRLGVDADQEATDIVGGELDALSIRQASDLIDHLRGLQPANGEQSNGR